MPRTPRRQSRVRFNLPLTRQDTAYSDTSTSSHIRNLTEAEVDLREEAFVANWLMTDGTPPPRPYRVHASQFADPDRVPPSLSTVPASLLSLLLHNGATKLGLVPPDDIPPAVLRTQPQIFLRSKLKKTRNPYTHPGGRLITPMGYKAFYALDEQEYVIPPDSSSTPKQSELRISVTRDWSSRKLSKHRDDQLLIYRVPAEEQCYFSIMASGQNLAGVTVRRPEDANDPIRVQRHGHTSWDIGGKEEVWYLLGRNIHLISRVYNRIKDARPSLCVKMKRLFWRKFGQTRSPAVTYVLH